MNEIMERAAHWDATVGEPTVRRRKGKMIACIVTDDDVVAWIATLPGPRTMWGFTDKRERAMPLTPYWQERFVKFCATRHVVALFVQQGKEVR